MLTSPQNPRLKAVAKLRAARERARSGNLIIDGHRAIRLAWAARVPVTELYLCPELAASEALALARELEMSGIPLETLSPKAFEKIAYGDAPDGLIAVAVRPPARLADIPLAGGVPLVVVVEALEKPGNLGNILRTADAVGATGVVVCDRQADVFGPNVIRASRGALFTVPVAEADREETVDWLARNGLVSVAATPAGDRPYTEAPLSGPAAIIVGSEHAGLSGAWLAAAQVRVRIPMRGAADSLNVATATALLLYEALRQRGALH